MPCTNSIYLGTVVSTVLHCFPRSPTDLSPKYAMPEHRLNTASHGLEKYEALLFAGLIEEVAVGGNLHY